MDRIKPPNGSSEIVPTWKLDLERSAAIVRWMDLLAQTYSTDIPTADITRLWLQTLKDYPLAAINHGFQEAVRECKFPPRPSDVCDRCQVWMEIQEGKNTKHVEPHQKPCDCDFTKVDGFCEHGFATGPDALKQVLSTAHVNAPPAKVYEIPGYEERKRILAAQAKGIRL